MTNAQTLLQEGLSAFRARAYDQALQAWRALLEIEPNNQQVIQLVERTETLAAEGQLVHSLKEELADLREELATTRQARNELLMEMARVHKRYQAREARLWRLQEEREWELRDALARAELSSFTDTPNDNDPSNDASALNTQQELTQNALTEAHAHIERLRHALDQARTQIDALEQDQHAKNAPQHAPIPPDAEQNDVEQPAIGPPNLPANSPLPNQAIADTTTPTHDPIHDDRPKRADTAANQHTHASENDKPSSARQHTHDAPPSPIVDSDLDSDSDTPKSTARKTPTPYRYSAQKHTQTSHTLTVGRSFLETDEHPLEDTFAGPLISDEWLQESTDAIKNETDHVPDALVHIVQSATPPLQPEHTAPSSDPQLNDEIPSQIDGATNLTPDDTPDTKPAPHAPTNDAAPPNQRTSDAPSTLGNGTPPLPQEDLNEPTDDAALQTPQTPTQPDKPDTPAQPDKPAPSDKPSTTSSKALVIEPARRNIPDTAKIDAEPMDDKNLDEGFADELTSALGSTPAPPRLFTGVQPELPDFDILDDAPEKLAPEDLDKYPTAIPVRHTTHQDLDDPIARYLLTHVDGVSTFMELRGTVGLPPAAVDRGFRILLAHDVIRVQHQ